MSLSRYAKGHGIVGWKTRLVTVNHVPSLISRNRVRSVGSLLVNATSFAPAASPRHFPTVLENLCGVIMYCQSCISGPVHARWGDSLLRIGLRFLAHEFRVSPPQFEGEFMDLIALAFRG